ncbi:MAG: hypothetical protein COW00_13590 [Bdellovibrio sp. CG12_big_fil_rev_8_21_14_0_65_39_13]|nr:MAG: hypothetical protein COW78_07015 [Bdellovibrio sp. CG22_combo_CG10-13_8_21_14_all_39_27]PIQ58649.1 MAG: hypothetical protein COW00_13590 [Bdellovibrio sp. CG12_big_fil_rev_8_21_14_0_65_39_13]PIR33024.1 MAG: hypothetical protein COV37_18185 [Bdellovibrio sp. CG11_big_fil_rev_8_21_14_0_20_39_38]
MAKIFDSLLLHKLALTKDYLLDNLKNDLPLSQSKKLTDIAKNIIEYCKQSNRDDLQVRNFFEFFADILGIHYTSIAHHESIKQLCITNYGLEALMLLRPQFDSFLKVAHFFEPKDDLNEIHKRVEEFEDWRIIKMSQNLNKSKNFDLFKALPNKSYDKDILKLRKKIQEKYKCNHEKFEELSKRNHFLSSEQIKSLTKNLNIFDFYNHVKAESSASLHVTDLSDRMRESERDSFDGYTFQIKIQGSGFYPLHLSNLILVHQLMCWADFFDIKDIIYEEVKDLYGTDK